MQNNFSYKSKGFQNILKEIFITKMISALNVGPKFYPVCGYDAVWYNDGVQFFLEKCNA